MTSAPDVSSSVPDAVGFCGLSPDAPLCSAPMLKPHRSRVLQIDSARSSSRGPADQLRGCFLTYTVKWINYAYSAAVFYI